MTAGTIIWILTIALCSVFFFVSLKQKGKAEVSFSNYAIAGGTLPFFLLFFSHFGNIMGVGNFIGHAGSAYVNGLPWLAFILGEQGSKIIFAFAFAGMAGAFTYNSFVEMIDDLISRDKVTRAMAAVLACCIMIAWTGGQGKAFGEIFNVFTGANPVPIILLFSAIFVVYTTLGGIYSLVWMDCIQGSICLIFGIIFYTLAFKKIDYSFAVLGERLADIGKGNLFTFEGTSAISLITKFVTGCIGILVAQLYWQPSFSAKSPATARRSMLTGGTIAIVFTCLTALTGLIILSINPGLEQNDAMPWFMLNEMPLFVTVMIFVMILAAGMSSADSNLNSAAVVITNDIIKPFFKPDITDAEMIKTTRIATVVIGVCASLGAIFASSVMSLFSKAYSMAGAGLVPLLVIGLLWKEKPGQTYTMGVQNSKVTPWGARCSILVGAVMSQITALGPNATLIALVCAAVVLIVVSMLTKSVPNNPKFISKGNEHPIPKVW